MSTDSGKIIFLHGASSSGKSSIAKALQDKIHLPFWHISIDHLRDSGVLPTKRFDAGDFNWKGERDKFFDGFHASLSAYAANGNNLIIEHIIEKTIWKTDLPEILSPFDVFFVAIHCPLDVLEAREKIRANRPIGSAAEDFATIHQGWQYDLEIDGTDNISTNVATVIEAWQKRPARSAFFANCFTPHPA